MLNETTLAPHKLPIAHDTRHTFLLEMFLGNPIFKKTKSLYHSTPPIAFMGVIGSQVFNQINMSHGLETCQRGFIQPLSRDLNPRRMPPLRSRTLQGILRIPPPLGFHPLLSHPSSSCLSLVCRQPYKWSEAKLHRQYGNLAYKYYQV